MRVCTGRDGLADAEQKNPSLAQWSSTSIDVHCRLLGSYIYIYVCMLPLLEAATVPLLIELSFQRHALLNAGAKSSSLTLVCPRLYSLAIAYSPLFRLLSLGSYILRESALGAQPLSFINV